MVGAVAGSYAVAAGATAATAAAITTVATTAATVGAYAVAGGIAATALSDVGEVFTGHNVIRDDLIGGNQEAYDTLKIGLSVVGAGIVELGANYNANSAPSAKADEGAGKNLSGHGGKTESYLTKRGWTWDSAQDIVGNPYTTREAVNKATGNSATVFYNKAGDYIVRDNITGELVQTSKFGDINWIPDSSIINPYKP